MSYIEVSWVESRRVVAPINEGGESFVPVEVGRLLERYASPRDIDWSTLRVRVVEEITAGKSPRDR